MALEETPLSLIGATVASRGPDPLGILERLLRSHGGLERRRCHFIELSHTSKEYKYILGSRWYRLSQLQSDFLCDILYSYPKDLETIDIPWDDHSEVERRVKELVLGLTENDLVASPNDEARSTDESASTSNDEESLDNKAWAAFAESEEYGFGSKGYEDSEDDRHEGADGGNEFSVARHGTRE